MTLTEEQREAIRAVSDLPRAIGCTRCHNYIQKNYSNQFAVLRSMIDNKDYVPNAAKLIELLAAGEHEQWADWAQSILDSEPGLSEGRKAAWPGMIATPYENLSEELKDKDRREVYLRSGDALAEIERLRAENMELQVAVFGSDGIRANQACIIVDQAARISDLEIEITGLKADLEQSEEIKRLKDELENYGDHYACLLISKDAQIKELEGMLSIRTEELDIAHSVARSEKEMHEKELAAFARRIKELEEAHKKSGAKYAKIINELRSSVYANIPGLDVGKIGPDAKPRSWQITEERIGLLEYCLETLLDAPDIEEIPGPGHSIEMLRAMLREAEQCE